MSKTKPTTGSVVEIKNYPASLIHNHKTENGEFSAFSFKWNNQWCSCILPTESVSQSITRKGKTLEDRQNIMLGDPEQVRSVSVLNEDNTYQKIAMFNRSILAAVTENRQEYLRSIAV